MRVLSPERVAAFTVPGDRYAYGLPCGGQWIEVPDYFRQITKHQTDNDVIHAKIVDDWGTSYTTADLFVHYPNESFNREMQQSLYSGGHNYLSHNLYSTEKRWVRLQPSPKYKGKSPKPKYVERDVRVSDPIATTFLVGCHTEQRGLSTYQCWRLSGRIYAFKQPMFNPGGSSTADLVYQDFYIDSAIDFSAFPIVHTTYSVRVRSDGRDCFYHPAIHRIVEKWTDFAVKRSDYDAEYATAMAIVRQHLTHDLSDAPSWLREYGYNTTAPLCTATVNPFPALDLQHSFILNEPAYMEQKSNPNLAGMMVGLSTYHIEKLTQHALLEACNSLPRLNDNTISNIIEIVGFIKSLVVDHTIEIPKSLSSSWLSYRYQYNTTKLDVEEAIKFVHRYMDLGTLDRKLFSHAVHHDVIHGVDVTCRCSMEIVPKHLSILSDIWRALDTYGLTPDFYVIWDMVPYSFMVDWFLPVSDILSVVDANHMYFSGEFYEIPRVVYSISYTRELNDRNVKCYTRWKGEVPPSLNGFYWLDAPSASSKTAGYRLLDSASIFIGK